MLACALDASSINVFASSSTGRYCSRVSTKPDGPAAVRPGNAAVRPGGAAVLPDELVTAWRHISACHAHTSAALEHELGEKHGLGVSDFEVLDRLAESLGLQARSQDLAEAVHLSQSALSRLVDRLERHGLVERCSCDMDRRGIYVVLTEAGQRRHAEAVPTHRDVLARKLPVGLTVAVASQRDL